MSFGNLFFVFVFLPLVLLVYFLVPKRFVQARNVVLVLFSLLFYSWGNPSYLILLLFSMIFNYAAVLEMAHIRELYDHRWVKLSMIVTVAADLLLLGVFKYYGFLMDNINALFHAHLSYTTLSSPIGISFYTFTILSYVFDVYYEKCEPQANFISYALFASFFAKIVMGPIVEYRKFEDQILSRTMNKVKFGAGVNMFIVGLAKKVLIADHLGIAYAGISGLGDMSILSAWLGMICYSLELYFDFSGYSDMAIGIAKMLGFDFDANFVYPYRAESISDFWRRWHASLGSWFRDYVYIPLGGNRCSVPRQIFNLLVVWFLTGLWHGSAWNFIVWGLWHGAFVLLEKFVLKDFLAKWPKALKIFYSIVISFFGWVWFFNDSLTSSLQYFGQMFGAGHMGLIDSTGIYYLTTYLLLIIIAFIGSGPLVQKLHQRFVYRNENNRMAAAVSVILYMLLFIVCIAGLVNSTYSSFLYFQF